MKSDSQIKLQGLRAVYVSLYKYDLWWHTSGLILDTPTFNKGRQVDGTLGMNLGVFHHQIRHQ
jgi:hypothetical protein